MTKTQNKDAKLTHFLIGIVIVLLVIVLFAVSPIGAYRLPVTLPPEGGGGGGVP